MNIAKLAILAVAAISSPSLAATTVLDFNAAEACSLACTNGVPILATYGDTADVNVSYLVRSGAGDSPVVGYFLLWWDVGFSNLQGVATGAQVTEIRLKLLSSGKSMTLDSFDMGRITGAFLTDLRVYDLGWNLLWSVTSQIASFEAALVYAPNVSATNGLIIQHGPGSENRGLDNIVFTVTDAVTTPAVPEPASWAMMIAGFGLVGAAMRRRRHSKKSDTASVAS